MSLATSIGRYVDLYHQFHDECAASTLDTEGICTGHALGQTFKALLDQSATKGPGKDLSAYVVVVMKNLEGTASTEISTHLEEKAAKAIWSKIEKFAYPATGCVAGSIVGGVGGAVIGARRGGVAGAVLNTLLSVPAGCRMGAHIGTELYVINKGLKKIGKAAGVAESIKEKGKQVWAALNEHYDACHATVNGVKQLNFTPILWETTTPQSTTIKAYLGSKKTPKATFTFERPLLHTQKAFARTATAAAPASAPRTALVPVAPLPHAQHGLIRDPEFSMFMEQTARQIGDFAGDLSGIVPAYKRVETLMTQIAANPDQTLEILGKQLIKAPTNLYNRVTEFPTKIESLTGELTTNIQAGNLGATAGSVISVVSLIFAIMAVANEVLPILNELVHDIARKGLRHPKKVPEKVVKLMIKTTLNQVMSVKYFIKDFKHNPLTAVGNMMTNYIKTPETFARNIRNFVTGNRKARKKRRAMEAALRQQQEKIFLEAVTKVVGECFNSSHAGWTINPNEPLEGYLQKLSSDWFNWNKAIKRRIHPIDFLSFVNTIKTNLENKQFGEVRRISPTAHLKETTPPQTLVVAYQRTAVAAMQLEVQRVQLVANIKAFDEASKTIAEAVQELRLINQSLKETSVGFATIITSVNEAAAAINATTASLSATTVRVNETNQGLRETSAGLRESTIKLDAAADRFGETTDKLRTFLDTNEAKLKESLKAKLDAKKLRMN